MIFIRTVGEKKLSFHWLLAVMLNLRVIEGHHKLKGHMSMKST